MSPPSYRASHWGLGSKEQFVDDVPNPRDNSGMVGYGELIEVVYRTSKLGDPAGTEYQHKFLRERPILCYGNRDGRLYIVGGRYRCSWRGIVG